MNEVRCYQCGKAITDENEITTKNVSVGWFNSERKPFHAECWKKHHQIKMKKDALEAIVLIIGGILVFGGTALLLFLGTIGLVVIALSFALLVSLGIMYYRIEK